MRMLMKRKLFGRAGVFVPVVLAFVVSGTLGAQVPKKGAKPQAPVSTGPEIGEKIPAFSAVDQDGKTQTFESLRGPKGLLLLIHRTADW